jgi:hypothetical protein
MAVYFRVVASFMVLWLLVVEINHCAIKAKDE